MEANEKKIQHMQEQIDQMYSVIKDLAFAVDFYDRVMAAPLDDRIAVGQDHHNWILSAARRGAELKKQIDTEWMMEKI